MIEILHYERVNKKKVIGFVDIKVTILGLCFIIRKIAHFQNAEKKWFNLPTFVRDRPDGSPQYLKYWQLEIEVHNGQILESLHEKVKEYCLINKIAEVQPLDFNSNGKAIEIDELLF